MVIALTILLAITQLLDGYTTLVVLKRGGRELNPIMEAAFNEFGREETLMLKGIIVTVIGYLVGRNQFLFGDVLLDGIWLELALVAFYVGVIAFNWRSMPR